MKKHVLLAAALCVTAVMATACGSKNTQETTAAVEASAAETSAADTTKPDLSNVDPRCPTLCLLCEDERRHGRYEGRLYETGSGRDLLR